MSLIKVAWYVLRVKNVHPGSPSDPSGTTAAEGKPRYIYSILEFQDLSQTAPAEAKPRCVCPILKPDGQSSSSPVRQLPSQGKSGHPQTPVGPLLSKAKPSYEYSILKPHGQSSRGQVRLLPPRRSRGAYTQF